VSILSHEAK